MWLLLRWLLLRWCHQPVVLVWMLCTFIPRVYACMCACTYACMYMCMYVNVCVCRCLTSTPPRRQGSLLRTLSLPCTCAGARRRSAWRYVFFVVTTLITKIIVMPLCLHSFDRWEEGKIMGMSGEGVTPISNLSLAEVRACGGC